MASAYSSIARVALCIFIFFVFPARLFAEAASAPSKTDLFEQGVSRNGKWVDIAQKRAHEIKSLHGGILLIGDSIAARWPKDIQTKYFGHRFINLGIGGDRVENIVWRLRYYDLKDSGAPATVIIAGTNNLQAGDTAEEIFEKLRVLIAKIESAIPRTPVFVSDVLPRGKFFAFKRDTILKLNDLIESNGQRYGYSPLFLYEKFSSSCKDVEKCDLLADYTHPNSTGYDEISKILKAGLSHKK